MNSIVMASQTSFLCSGILTKRALELLELYMNSIVMLMQISFVYGRIIIQIKHWYFYTFR